jgi:hypothetical protein
MKKMIFFGSLLLAIVLLSPVQAQNNNQSREKMRAAVKDLVTNLRNWAQDNVIPEMRKWKDQLDSKMNKEDLSKLNDLRSQASDLRKQGMMMAGARENGNIDKSMMEKRKDNMNATREKRDALIKEVEPFSTKYKPELENIKKEAEPYVVNWKKDADHIINDWYKNHEGDVPSQMKNMLDRRINTFKMYEAFQDNSKDQPLAWGFLLWDGKDLPKPDEMMNNR